MSGGKVGGGEGGMRKEIKRRRRKRRTESGAAAAAAAARAQGQGDGDALSRLYRSRLGR